MVSVTRTPGRRPTSLDLRYSPGPTRFHIRVAGLGAVLCNVAQKGRNARSAWSQGILRCSVSLYETIDMAGDSTKNDRLYGSKA
jgi:hypothetical protein